MKVSEMAAVLVLVGVVAVVVVYPFDSGCGPWNPTRSRLALLEMMVEPCNGPSASLRSRLHCLYGMIGEVSASRRNASALLVDAYDTPIHFGPTEKCRTVKFCSIYSSGPDRVDDCGGGDDIAQSRPDAQNVCR